MTAAPGFKSGYGKYENFGKITADFERPTVMPIILDYVASPWNSLQQFSKFDFHKRKEYAIL